MVLTHEVGTRPIEKVLILDCSGVDCPPGQGTFLHVVGGLAARGNISFFIQIVGDDAHDLYGLTWRLRNDGQTAFSEVWVCGSEKTAVITMILGLIEDLEITKRDFADYDAALKHLLDRLPQQPAKGAHVH